MKGKYVAGGLVGFTLIFGAALYYANQYAYYRKVSLGPDLAMTLVPKAGGAPVPLSVADFQGIDASSSPIRFRACFTTAMPLAEIAARFTPYKGAEPLMAPHWFGCFNAKAISLALKAGRAQAFLSRRRVAKDVDRIIAVFPDGRAFAWQQLDPSVPQDTSMVE